MTSRDFNTITRTDIGDLLVHWTRSTSNATAFTILKKIIREGKILGGDGFIRGKYKCVCFTESPIGDLVKVFSLAKANEDKEKRNRYEPFGIGVKKGWLFQQGGRPVIYGSSDDFDSMNEGMRWRYVNYSPPHTDFTWEREWRIQTEELEIPVSQIVVIVPGKNHAQGIIEKYGSEYLVFALSVLGLPSHWTE